MIRRQTTNLLEIFWKLSLYSQVIFKSMKVADDISRGTLECEWVKGLSNPVATQYNWTFGGIIGLSCSTL